MTDKLVIYGAGGSGSEALWVAREMSAAGSRAWDVVGILDDNPERDGTELDGVRVVLGTRAQTLFRPGEVLVHIAIGANKPRRRLAEKLAAAGYGFATLVHPRAIVAPTATIGDGTMIGPMAVVAPHATVGRHVLVNSFVGVGHHAEVGEYANLCPGVRVSGGVRVGRGVFVGSNAVILPGAEVGEGATVGASSLVIRRVAPRHSVMGVPARILSRPAADESTAHTHE